MSFEPNEKHFMKRKTALKFVAFVLFGLCLLSGRKAEAMLVRNQKAIQEALESNKKVEKLLIGGLIETESTNDSGENDSGEQDWIKIGLKR
jgi:hypothetical protein